MKLVNYKNFLIIISLCEPKDNIANNCYDYCCDCCCGICHDCIEIKKEKEKINNTEDNLNRNYDFVINDDKHIDNKNFIAVNYENSKNKYSLEGLKTINSTCFNLNGDEYSELVEIYRDAFLFFVNIKEEGKEEKRIFKKTESYSLEWDNNKKEYNFETDIDIEPNNNNNDKNNKPYELFTFWFWYKELTDGSPSSFCDDFLDITRMIKKSDSTIYNFKEIVFFLFGYLNKFIEENKEKRYFTPKEYSTQVESMLKIFLYITQGLRHCEAGQYEALQVAFVNTLDDFLSKYKLIEIDTDSLCKLALTLYAKKIFNMVFTFTKIKAEHYQYIRRIGSNEQHNNMNLAGEKSMFTMYINNIISEYFGFKYVKTVWLDPITCPWAINYETIRFLVQHNTHEAIKIKENGIEIDPNKIQVGYTNEQYIEKKKNEFVKLCTEIMTKAMGYYFDSAFEEVMLQKIVESTKDNKTISDYNNGDSQKKRDIVKKILIEHDFFKYETYNYTYVIDN